MLENIKEKLYRFSLSNKLLIFSIIVIVLLLIFYFYNVLTIKNRFINSIEKLGYSKLNDSNLYYYNVGDIKLDNFNYYLGNNIESYYEMNYFDVDDMVFKKNIRDYSDNNYSLINEIYDYKNNSVNYSYRLVSNNEATLIFSGKYLLENSKFIFTCNRDYRYQFDVNEDDELICNYLKVKVLDFYDEAFNGKFDYYLINKLIK